MTEIFKNIPDESKKRAAFMFDLAMRQPDILSAVNSLNEYTETCQDEEEQEFVEFFFRMKLEELMNRE